MKLVHASMSENSNAGWDGKAQAGDQTGKECCIVPFYKSPWNIVLRYPDAVIRKRIAQTACKLAKSRLVGYDQSERNTLYQRLKYDGFDVEYFINRKFLVETDCSAFVYACCATHIPTMRQDGNAPTTYTMRTFYSRWGFTVLTDPEMLDGKNLVVGDILVNENAHTAIVCETDTEEKPVYNSGVYNAITVIAKDVIKGNWGNGAERKENIYNAIQKRVNELLK